MRSVGLTAYLYAHQNARGKNTVFAPRPDGTVIWAHATENPHIDALRQLADRIRTYIPDLFLLLSVTDAAQVESAGAAKPLEHVVVVPEDSVLRAAEFLEHWRPDFVIWTAGALRPTLIERVARKGTPIGFVDADEKHLARSAWRWLPNFQRGLFENFDFIMTRDLATQRSLARLGLRQVDLSLGGPLFDGGINLQYNEQERTELAQVLLGRPIWLAAHVTASEIPAILEAHRDIMRFSHRALLIVSPAHDDEAAQALATIEQSGLRHLVWSGDTLPDETTQILFADHPGDLGLWYRIAPVSFMGSSLYQDGTGSDPNQPAAHGSAILHGPHTGRLADTYSRFSDAGAACLVRDAQELANTVKRLFAPDKSAAMAHAAWEVASRSATLTDRLADRILSLLDAKGAQL